MSLRSGIGFIELIVDTLIEQEMDPYKCTTSRYCHMKRVVSWDYAETTRAVIPTVSFKELGRVARPATRAELLIYLATDLLHSR